MNAYVMSRRFEMFGSSNVVVSEIGGIGNGCGVALGGSCQEVVCPDCNGRHQGPSRKGLILMEKYLSFWLNLGWSYPSAKVLSNVNV